MARFDSSQSAFVVIGMVAFIALILKVYMVFNPPQAVVNTTTDDYSQFVENFVDYEASRIQEIDATLEKSDETTPIVEATLQSNDADILEHKFQTELANGLAPSLLVEEDNLWLGYVKGNSYVVQRYTTAYEAVDEPITLVKELNWDTVSSSPVLSSMNDQWVLLHTDSTVATQPKHHITLVSQAGELVWENEFAATGTVTMAVNALEITIVVHDTTTATVRHYDTNGQLINATTLEEVDTIIAAMYDRTDTILFTQSVENIGIIKLASSGEVVRVIIPNEGSELFLQDMYVANEYLFGIATHLTDYGVVSVWSEDVSTRYVAPLFEGERRFGQLTSLNEQLYMVGNSTETSVTEDSQTITTYSIIVDEYSISSAVQ